MGFVALRFLKESREETWPGESPPGKKKRKKTLTTEAVSELISVKTARLLEKKRDGPKKNPVDRISRRRNPAVEGSKKTSGDPARWGERD